MGGNDEASEEEAGLIVTTYGDTPEEAEAAQTTDPLEWPSGEFLVHILKTEGALPGGFVDNHQEPEYWQASARRALLHSFGYLPTDGGGSCTSTATTALDSR